MQPASPGRESVMEPGLCDRPPGKKLRLDAEAREEPATGGEARKKPVAGGEAREKPAAGAESEEKPAAGGEARKKPAAGGEAREKPAAGGETRERPAAGGEAREKPAAGGEAREKPAAGREAREKPAAGGEARKKPTADAVARERQDGAYFHSYSDVSIHEEMIADVARTGSYRRALQWGCRQGPQPGPGVGLLHGLTVLDVGAGTGILSAFCAQAGAARVYACEACAVMVERAREVVVANGLRGRVRVLQGRVEDARLPQPVDAIVSEWMGYGLMYESMLRSVLHARDRWLKPGGLIFPCRAELYLAPVTDPALQERLSFWAGVKERHGVDMSCMSTFARRCLMNDEMAVATLHGEDVLGQPSMFAAIDLYTVTEQELAKLGGDFTTTSFGIATMHAFALWFNVIFPTSAPTREIAHEPLATSTNANGPDATVANANGGQAASFNVQDRDIPGPRAASVDADFKTGAIANNDCHASGPNLCEASANTVNANTIRHNAFTTNSDNHQPLNVNGDDHRTFDVNAKELEPIILSTSPFAEETHWKQSLLYLDEPVELFQDTVLKGKITLTPAEDNPRYLRITLNYEIGNSGKKTKTFKMGEDYPPFE
ncbi:protein arginine N-methyltransferase 6-like [Leucoraja erinacea]|uniref:protein arginine N-methyltransferase 6-like n=1 Tax=Leucoraja erinaceus TaxID=7782 RepID=UPI002454B307|nr:protein arginine N-methyltransferase 6-like [Leucoraja erinacea]